MASRWFNQYRTIADSFVLYWKAYGGLPAFVGSPYLHLTVAVSFFVTPDRLSINGGWYDTCLSVVSSLLGFTLGGYAILMAFGDDKFRALISGADKDGKPSPYMVVNGTFVHFIVVQGVCLLVALICKASSWKTGMLATIGSALFIYAIFTAIAAGLAVLNLANWFDLYRSSKAE